jgi:hypothetical protein
MDCTSTELDVLFIVACVSNGIGLATANALLSVLGHSPINYKPWTRMEEFIFTAAKSVWVDVQEENLKREVELMEVKEVDENGRVKLIVTFDGTWTRCGFLSLFGSGTYFGVHSKLPLFIATRC